MELFYGNIEFPKAGIARLCVCVYEHIPSMYRVLVYSLAAPALYIHTKFFSNC